MNVETVNPAVLNGTLSKSGSFGLAQSRSVESKGGADEVNVIRIK